MLRDHVMRWSVRLALLALPLGVLGCEPGAPPPGPVDIVHKIFDPSYDYTQSSSTWGGDDRRESRAYHHENWSAPCADDQLSCSNEGTTICCSRHDRCCAGHSGPYCCGDAGYDDRAPRYDGE
jgi:hypothetical protein